MLAHDNPTKACVSSSSPKSSLLLTTMSDFQLPQKQKAWQVVRRGLPKNAVVLNEQADVPSRLGHGDVLIKVQAAAFNPV